MGNRIRLFNTYVDNLNMDETVEKINEIINRGIPTQHVVINASKVNLMSKNLELKEIVNNCEIINADGASILWANRIINGFSLKERVTGIDLFMRLVEEAPEKNHRIYLFGAKEDVVKKVKIIFEEKYPSIQIVGCRNGYFTEEDELDIVKDIHDSKADILFVAFSSPKKEFWIDKYLKQMDIPFVMGVGGSFDIVAGLTKRAPIWMQKFGLEWFFRFIQEPIRMFKRYICGNLFFVYNTYKYKKLVK